MEVEYDIEIKPIKSSHLLEVIQKNIEVHNDYEIGDNGIGMDGIVDYLRANKEYILGLSLGKEYETIDEALASDNHNRTQTVNENLSGIINMLEKMDGLGQEVKYYNPLQDEITTGVIGRVRLPKPTAVQSPGQYEITVFTPGNDPYRMSMNSCLQSEHFAFTGRNVHINPTIAENFDEVEPGFKTQTRCVIDGNPLLCAQEAARMKKGRFAFYTDDKNNRIFGVLMPVTITKQELLNELVVIPESYIATRAIQNDHICPGNFLSSTTKHNETETIGVSLGVDGNYIIKCPGTKVNGGHVFLNEKLNDLMMAEFSGDPKEMKGTFRSENLSDVMDVLHHDCNVRFVLESNQAREWVNSEIKLAQQPEQKNEVSLRNDRKDRIAI